jgi:hypothetical protein
MWVMEHCTDCERLIMNMQAFGRRKSLGGYCVDPGKDLKSG